MAAQSLVREPSSDNLLATVMLVWGEKSKEDFLTYFLLVPSWFLLCEPHCGFFRCDFKSHRFFDVRIELGWNNMLKFKPHCQWEKQVLVTDGNWLDTAWFLIKATNRIKELITP